MSASQQWETACHEAGHAVLAAWSGRPVREVWLERRGDQWVGHCDSYVVLGRGAPIETAVSVVAGIVAGIIAERLARGECLERDSDAIWRVLQLAGDDPKSRCRGDAWQAAMIAGSCGHQPYEVIAGGWRAATEILRANWPQVEAIASALIAAGKLDGTDLRALLLPPS